MQGLGSRRSKLVDALRNPNTQEDLLALNEMAKWGLFSDSGMDGPDETLLLEGAGVLGGVSRGGNTRSSQIGGSYTDSNRARARAAAMEDSMMFGWASRRLGLLRVGTEDEMKEQEKAAVLAAAVVAAEREEKAEAEGVLGGGALVGWLQTLPSFWSQAGRMEVPTAAAGGGSEKKGLFFASQREREKAGEAERAV